MGGWGNWGNVKDLSHMKEESLCVPVTCVSFVSCSLRWKASFSSSDLKRIEMSSNMADSSQFAGHGLEDGGKKTQGGKELERSLGHSTG